MIRFIIRRVLLSIPVLIGIVFLVFALARIIPGDPCSAALGERANPETCEQYAIEHGLDKAIIPGVFRVDGQIEVRLAEVPATLIDNQFVIYLQSIAAGEFGESSKFGLPVTDLLIQRLPDDRGADALRADVRDHRGHHPRQSSPRTGATPPPTSAPCSSPTSASRRRSSCWACCSRTSSPSRSTAPRSSCRRRVALPAGTVGPGAGRGVGPGGSRRAAARRSIDFLSNIYTFNAIVPPRWRAPRRHGATHDPARPGPRHDPPGDHRADDPLEPARRARARLRPDRSGQGPERSAGRHEARASATRSCRS